MSLLTMKTVGVIVAALIMVGLTSGVKNKKTVNQRILAKVNVLANKVNQLLQREPKDPYVQLNTDPVCFGAKDNQFGSFKALKGGNLIKIKLVHLWGYVSCDNVIPVRWSHWGCGEYVNSGSKEFSAVAVTTAADTYLFPPSEINRGSFKWALIPGYNSRSPEMVMSVFDTPVTITSGQDLRLWYIEDLENGIEGDNHGRVCADVYGYFV